MPNQRGTERTTRNVVRGTRGRSIGVDAEEEEEISNDVDPLAVVDSSDPVDDDDAGEEGNKMYPYYRRRNRYLPKR